MSMQAINYALTLPVDEPGPRLLMILIAHHVNWKTGDMFVSQDELADEAKMSSRTVRSHLCYLEDRGLIIRHQQRATDGRRGVDRIEFVGYLNWQHVLYHGGTIPPPSSRGKPVQTEAETPPEDFASGDDANRKNHVDQPENSGAPTGSSFPVYKEPFLTINKTMKCASAHATQGAACSRQEPPAALVLACDPMWDQWLQWLRDKGQTKALRMFEAEGAMVVFSGKPYPESPFPKLAPKQGSDKRDELEAKRERSGHRNRTGEAA